MLEVIDTGHGIAAKDIPKALSRFGQVGTSYTRHHDGVGIGLSLVQMFAALHNASFILESGIGKGTTARVIFPAERTITPSAK
jgi:signal transduction histidine kinase